MLSPSELARLATTLGGIPILGCLEGSPADALGVRYGDILLSVNGIPTGSWNDFLEARAQCQGQLVARLFRQGTEFEVTIALRAATRSPLEVLGELQDRGIMPGAQQ